MKHSVIDGDDMSIVRDLRVRVGEGFVGARVEVSRHDVCRGDLIIC
jgi:hypothetical protein